MYIISVQRTLCHYNAVTLPGDCHASHASLLTNRLLQATIACLMLAYSFSPRVHSIPRGPRFSARNDTVLRTEWNESLFAEKNSKIYIHSSLCYLVQRTLCHCEAPLCGAVAISRKGHLVIPRKILLYLCREKNEAYDAWNEHCCH